MVEAAPLSLITIRSLCSVMSFGTCRHVREATIKNHKQTLRFGIVIKVARYDDVGIRRSRLYGVSKGADRLCCCHTEGTRISLSSPTTGEMRNHDMQRITPPYKSLCVQNVSCGTHALHSLHAHSPAFEQPECVRRIEKRHVDAALVVGLRHDILITGVSEQRTLGEIAQNAVVLHLAQSYEVRQLPIPSAAILFLLIFQILPTTVLTASYDGLTDAVKLAPITIWRPVIRAFRKKLRVVLQRVMTAVEEILAV